MVGANATTANWLWWLQQQTEKGMGKDMEYQMTHLWERKKAVEGGAEEEREMQSSQNERDRSHVGMIVVTVAAAV